jgi:predicted nucleic acid-binding protein
MIFLDTSVLSHVFRRSKSVSPSEVVTRFTSLVEQDSPLVIPGVVFQEVLSGVRDQDQFDRLRGSLDGFPRIFADERDHVEAARLLNLLRARGITASSFDSLIAAMTILRDGVLFTVDRDFESFARLASLRLLESGSA